MKKLFLIPAACLVLAACGDDKDPIADAVQASKDKDLQGQNFQSECQIKPLDALLTGILSGGQASIKSSTTTYRFDGSAITRTTALYTSLDCTGDNAIRMEEQGEFDINPDAKTQDLGKQIDIEYKQLLVSTVTEDGAQAANALGLCAANDWTSNGEQRDQTSHSADLNCYGAALPRKLANIYRVDAGVLYLGTQNNSASSASDRPQQLDMNTKYTSK